MSSTATATPPAAKPLFAPYARPSGTSVKPLWQFFAESFAAWDSCTRLIEHSKDPEAIAKATAQRDRYRAQLEQAARDYLPSHSGFDGGTQFDFEGSSRDKLCFVTWYHHMTAGRYTGWTRHVVTLRPSFSECPEIDISGPDQGGSKEFIEDAFKEAFRVRVAVVLDPRLYAGSRVVAVPAISSLNLAHAAAALWEAVLDIAYVRREHAASTLVRQTLLRHGHDNARLVIADLAAACHIGWVINIREGYDPSFDLGFCREFATKAIAWHPKGADLPALRGDWEEACLAIGKAA